MECFWALNPPRIATFHESVLLKLTLAKERNLKTLSDPDVVRKISTFSDRVLEAKYIFRKPGIIQSVLEDVLIRQRVL